VIRLRRIHILVPGLAGWPQCREGLNRHRAGEVAALVTWCRRGRRNDGLPAGLENTLAYWARIPVQSKQDLPVAAISRYGEEKHVAGGGYWLRCDPVHFNAEHSGVRLLDVEPDTIDHHEAKGLTDAIAALYREEGWQVFPLAGQRWYLRLPTPPPLMTTPLYEVAGQAIDDVLPGGPAQRQWRQILTEIQMVLHRHAINEQRQQQGRPVINGVWFWGGGESPEVGPLPWQTVTSDEPFAIGLARCSKVPAAVITGGAERVIDTLEQDALVVVSALRPAVSRQTWPLWWRQLRRVHDLWLVPLVEALRRGRVDELNLFDGSGRVFTLTRRRLHFFWSRNGLESLLQ